MPQPPTLLAYETHAEEHTDTVVLLHSLALDRRVWHPLIPALAQQRAVINLDLRGHGQSPDDEDFTVEDMADDVAFTLEELGVNRALVVGLSMGGCVAQAFAARHPQRVESLGLVDTTAWYGPDAREAWSQRAVKAKETGLRSLAEFQLTRWFTEDFRSANPELCEELLEVFAANDLGSYVATCHALGAVDLRAEISSIKVPTVVVVGEEDPATTPEHAADLRDRIEGAVLHVVPKAKHLTPLEKPAAVVEAIQPLL